MNYRKELWQKQVKIKLERASVQIATPNYFEITQFGSFRPKNRQTLISWFQSVASLKQINRYVIFRAIDLLDAFLSGAPSLSKHPLFQLKGADGYTLAAAIAFDLAGKMDTNKGISKSAIKTFKMEAVAFTKAEEYFLEVLGYDISFPDQVDVIQLVISNISGGRLCSSRPETPFDDVLSPDPSQQSCEQKLIECSVKMLVFVVADPHFIGVSILQQSVTAILAAAQIRSERIMGWLRDFCDTYKISFNAVQIGARSVADAWRRQELLDC